MAQQQRRRSHVTYTFPQAGPATVTILENRGVLSADGTTGLRTWDAAMHLASYLTVEGQDLVRGKRVLELGAGTGLVALVCAKALGAANVLATDGSPDVVDALQDGIFVNGLQGDGRVSAAKLRWGRYPEVQGLGPGDFDVVVGADIVSKPPVAGCANGGQTYDDSSVVQLLASTLGMFLDENPAILILISATIRNEQTFADFTSQCRKRLAQPCKANHGRTGTALGT